MDTLWEIIFKTLGDNVQLFSITLFWHFLFISLQDIIPEPILMLIISYLSQMFLVTHHVVLVHLLNRVVLNISLFPQLVLFTFVSPILSSIRWRQHLPTPSSEAEVQSAVNAAGRAKSSVSYILILVNGGWIAG